MRKTGPTSLERASPSQPEWLRAGKQGARPMRISLSSNFKRLLVIALLSLLLPEKMWAQAAGQDAHAAGAVDVRLMLPDGEHFSGLARVRLLTQEGIQAAEGSVDVNGHTIIQGLIPSTYIVEASAPGFLTVQETVILETKYSQMSVQLTMKPEETEKSISTKLAQPILAPTARKELEKGLEAFRGKDFAQARKHFEKAQAMAPGNPDVQFLMGVLELQEKNVAAAEEHLQKAIQIFPNHVRSLETLGEIYSSEGKVKEALPLLEKGVSLEEGSWRAHWKLGQVYLEANEPKKALEEAERAIGLGKSEAGSAHILKAEALADLGRRGEAEQTLDRFLTEQPNDPTSAKARALQSQLKQEELRAERVSSLPLQIPEGVSEVADLRPQVALSKGSLWAKPGIDEVVPKVAPNVSCSTSQVLVGVGKQAVKLMDSLERFAAVEQVTHFTVDKAGDLRSPQRRSYEYVVVMLPSMNGVLRLEEYRDGSLDPNLFPAHIATEGLPGMALIFHPQLASDFNFVCEGLGSIGGKPAWQVHFQQRTDRPSRIRAYVIQGKYHSVALKGRAWIDAGTHQVVRLESELVHPLPEIHLRQEHLSIEYAPVKFHSKNVQLWLPQSADLFVEEDKLAFYRTHTFSNFQLFSVGMDQQVYTPKESYSFTNTSDQEIRGQLTVTPVLERSITPLSISFMIPPRSSVIKTVGRGKDLDIPADWIASARFVYQGSPGVVEGDALLTKASTLEIVPESQPLPAAQN
jgi:tetratricopeptide (TPR) repeat protein